MNVCRFSFCSINIALLTSQVVLIITSSYANCNFLHLWYALLYYFKVSLFNNCIDCCTFSCNKLNFKLKLSLYIQRNRSIMWLISFNMLFDWPVVNYKLFESPNIADMGVYFLFIKLLMVCYFNCALFKVTYSMLRFFTVALLMPYCLLAFKVSFFKRHYIQCCSFKCCIFMLQLLLLYSFFFFSF